MTYTIIISAHNEEASIPTILASLRGMRERLGLQLDAILVSNGSSDETYAISLEFSQELEWLRVLNNPDGKGWGDGIKFGMGNSDPDGFVVTWPADLQFSPADVERMVLSHTQSEDRGAIFSVRISRTDGLLNSLRGSVWKWMLGKVVSPNCSDPASQRQVRKKLTRLLNNWNTEGLANEVIKRVNCVTNQTIASASGPRRIMKRLAFW